MSRPDYFPMLLWRSKKVFIEFVSFLAVVLLAVSAQATANYVYHDPGQLGPGCASGGYRQPLDPQAAQAVHIYLKAEYTGYTNMACLLFTTDGTDPSGAHCNATGTSQAVAANFACTATENGDVDVYLASLPAQPAGTTVKYIVSAWHSDGGDEIFANSGTCTDCGNCTTSSCANIFSLQIPVIADAGFVDSSRVDSSLADSALVDADLDDAQRPDSSVIQDAQTNADANQDDAAIVDAQLQSDRAVADSFVPDSFSPDASILDVTQADSAADLDSAAAEDSAQLDAFVVLDADYDDVNQADSQGADLVSSCSPSCRDEYYRIDCAADGTEIVLACPSGTMCREGHCLDSSADAGAKASGDGGCNCSSAKEANAASGFLVLFAVAFVLAWRRRAL